MTWKHDLYSRDGELVAAVRNGAMPSDEAMEAARVLRQIARQIALTPPAGDRLESD